MNAVPQLSTITTQPAQRQRPDYESANRFLFKARRELTNHEWTRMNTNRSRNSRSHEAQTERAEGPKENSPGQAK